MSRIAALCAALLLWLATGAQADGARTRPIPKINSTAAPAPDANTISDRGAPLVRELEARYGQSMRAARRGDVDAYWSMRTASSRNRPPLLDAQRLRLLADLLPPLETLHFVRLDTTGRTARALYRWRKEDVAQYSVITYRVESGEWKIDDVAVRRTGGAAASPAAPRAGAAVPQTPSDTPAVNSRAQELLRAWESGESATRRSLSAPRL